MSLPLLIAIGVTSYGKQFLVRTTIRIGYLEHVIPGGKPAKLLLV
jgi:hypothetical protein